MAAYIARRILLMFPTLLGILFVSFMVVQFAPGGPVERVMAQLSGADTGGTSRVSGGGGDFGPRGQVGASADVVSSKYRGAQGLDPDFIKKLEKQFGFDKPAPERFALMVWNFSRFDFGKSYFRDVSVIQLIKEKLPVSMSLGIWMTLLTYLISIPLGIRKAVTDGSKFDTWTSAVIIVGFAIPGFLFAILLIILFAGGSFLNIFPLRGLTSDGWSQFPWYWKIIDYFWHITLPLISMALGAFATMTLLTKNSFLDEIRKQYVMTARAKGCSERQVLYNHIFRNAMLIVIAGFPERVHSRLLLRLAVDRDHLLARRPRPARFRERAEPRLPGRVRHPVHLFADRSRGQPDLRPRLYAGSIRGSISRRGRSDDDHRAPARRNHDAVAARRNRAADPSRALRRRRSTAAAGRTSRPTAAAIGRSGSSLSFSWSRCSPISSPTTSHSSSSIDGQSLFAGLRQLFRDHLRRRFRNRRRLSRSLPAEADRGEGRHHHLAADPLLLRHPQSRPADAGAVEADLDADGGAVQGGGAAARALKSCRDLEYNWLGTDDQGRDVVARLIYGFRISVLFGLTLTIISSIIGIAAGGVQGYFGGWIDLLFQRFIEIWTAIPSLYLLLIISSVLAPGFFVLLGILLLFSWVSLVGLVRAEFLRGRNFEYIQAARALGVSNGVIMFRHLLPNAMVATMTFLPFIVSSSVMTLTALDFLGFGLPPGSPSLGELLAQGKANVQAPWLGLTGFFSVAIMLSLLIFIGEAVRDAFDPRKTFR